jgi:hypothetical protein
MTEPFGPIYEPPSGAPCPTCDCCTARLCQEAAADQLGACHLLTADCGRAVLDCPCSPTTRELQEALHTR